VLNDLEVRREALFASPSEPAVAAIDAPGSSAYAYDMTAVRTLRVRGAVARGVRSDFRSVVVHSAGPWRADLEVLEALRPHLIARPGAAGAADVVLERRPAPPPRHEVITLVRTDAGWRVAALGP
jgi:hypothetical protein